MLEFKGKWNTCKVFNDELDQASISQVYDLMNNEAFKDSTVRYMPDIHKGAGCTIGTTMTITDKVIPNFVGVDIGCGVMFSKLQDETIDFDKLDSVIRTKVPYGFSVHTNVQNEKESAKLIENLRCKKYVNIGRAYLSVGSLGGGNHFIEVDKDSDGYLYLVVHSGSRNLGKQVCDYYQQLAYDTLNDSSIDKNKIIEKLKKEGRQSEINSELAKVKSVHVDKNNAYLQGQNMEDYLHDMDLTQKYAKLNRKTMIDLIINGMGLTYEYVYETIHNYIEMKSMILRKGAVSAKKGEILIVPINMSYGSIICEGKGNPDWNYSANHGAGRLMSRGKAKQEIDMVDFENSMKGIYTTCVGQSTLDEAPQAYKDAESVLKYMEPTVKVLKIIKPVYNFKAN